MSYLFIWEARIEQTPQINSDPFDIIGQDDVAFPPRSNHVLLTRHSCDAREYIVGYEEEWEGGEVNEIHIR